MIGALLAAVGPNSPDGSWRASPLKTVKSLYSPYLASENPTWTLYTVYRPVLEKPCWAIDFGNARKTGRR